VNNNYLLDSQLIGNCQQLEQVLQQRHNVDQFDRN
jgi:hypothetical protein